MSGQASIRGYLLQTLVCLLDSLTDEPQWEKVVLEPDGESDKVDITWSYGSTRKVVQVRSSQNQINLRCARKWASELESTTQAEEYELRLLGPCSQSVAAAKRLGKVRVPIPDPLNVDAIVQRAAHALDKFLVSRPVPVSINPFLREIVVHALANRLAQYSTSGTAIDREDFQRLLDRWIAEVQPAISPSLPVGASAQVAHQLTPPPADFVGRDTELTRLSECIQHGARGVAIRGMPGIGKSALAQELASLVQAAFPDAQLVIDLRGNTSRPLPVLDAMGFVIRSLAPEKLLPQEDAQMRALYQSTLHGKHLLILLENARSAEQVESLATSSDSLFIVTSRWKFALPGFVSEDLSPLSLDESERFLVQVAPRIQPDAGRVAQICAGLPFALRLAGSALAERPDISAREYIDKLGDCRTRLDLAEASIATSFDLLPEPLRTRFSLLCLFPHSFSREAAAAIWETSESDAADTLGSLLCQSLIDWNSASRRYFLHDLIALFAADRAETTRIENAKWSFVQYFHDVCFTLEETYNRGHDGVNHALQRFDEERESIDVAFEWTAMQGTTVQDAARLCVEFVTSTVRMRDVRQHPFARMRWLALGFDNALRLHDGVTACSFVGELGRAWLEFGDVDRASECHHTAIDLSRRFGLKTNECVGFLQIGNVETMRGNPREALRNYDAALALARELDDPSLEAHAISNAGRTRGNLCEFQQAVDLLFDAAKKFGEIGDQQNLAKTLGSIGEIAHQAGDERMALEQLESALDIAKDLDDPTTILHFSEVLGRLKLKLGQVGEAVSLLEHTLSVAQELALPRFIPPVMRTLAIAYEANGASVQADELIERHQQIAAEIGDTDAEFLGEGTIAEMLERRKRTTEAMAVHERRIEMARRNKDGHNEGSALRACATFLANVGQIERALEYMNAALELARNAEPHLVLLLEGAISELRAKLADRSGGAE
ncbi:MAG TPA: tetratricopeptide repeat protein [Thermoguttaceae bacterium]|nr:tetratricopeptide repeat protein [Thermoguttaceae bacterium]